MMTLGLSSALGAVPSALAVGPAQNLLLWTEAMDNAVWTKTAVTVTPDVATNPSPPGDGSLTADSCSFVGATRFLRQTSSVAASSGGGTTTFTPSVGSWTRIVSTGVFDTGTYTVSCYVQGVSGAGQLKLNLSLAGGFINCNLESTGSVVALVWGWQLEVGASATDYMPRTT